MNSKQNHLETKVYLTVSFENDVNRFTEKMGHELVAIL